MNEELHQQKTKIIITKDYGCPIDNKRFEEVERKGIGHPDSLANTLAEEFSRKYSLYCIDKFGIIPNHWVDKITLVGASAKVQYGSYQIEKNINAYLFGKITTNVEKETIPILDIFKSAAHRILKQSLGTNKWEKYLSYYIDNSKGIGLDHNPDFYTPSQLNDFKKSLLEELVANDTVICSAYAPYSIVERLTIDLENYINSYVFKKKFQRIGSDVKILAVRYDKHIDITACLPFFPDRTFSFLEYKEDLQQAHRYMCDFIQKYLSSLKNILTFDLYLNTKDRGNLVYLTPFGTSLGKGDIGAVGRGNKYNGVITSSRPSNVEAVPGKNPLNHAGKLYNAISQNISQKIWKELELENSIKIIARNGGTLREPAYVCIDLIDEIPYDKQERLNRIVIGELENIHKYSQAFILTDTILFYKNGVLKFK